MSTSRAWRVWGARRHGTLRCWIRKRRVSTRPEIRHNIAGFIPARDRVIRQQPHRRVSMVIASLPRVAAIALVALALASCGGSSTPTTTSKWKMALMAATGTLLDHNFSEYSWLGAKKGAAAIGTKDPATVVPKDSTDYAKNIQNFVDAGYNMIITVASDESEATTKAAKANPNVKFIGVDQTPICVDEQGNWLLFGCKGDA